MEDRIRGRVTDDFDKWAEYSKRTLQGERVEELMGIIEAAGSGPLKLQHLVMSNVIYEMGMPTMCTGVLAARPDGTVIHGRNMDFAFPFVLQHNVSGVMMPQNWPDVTFDVTFHSNGKPKYAATMWPGFVGMATGMRFPENGQGGWSYQLNARLNNIPKVSLEAGNSGGGVGGLIARQTMEDQLYYQGAVNQMYTASYAAPLYFVLGGAGPYEGTIITIDRLGTHEIYSPPPVHMSKKRWYLVQTNDDQKNVAFDKRRPWAKKQIWSMKDHRQDLSVENTFHLLHTFPVLNAITVYSTVMVPKTGYYHTILPTQGAPPVARQEGSCEACVQLVATKAKSTLQSQMPILPQQAPPPAPVLTPTQAGKIAAIRESAEREQRGPRKREGHQRHRLRGVMPGSLMDVTSLLQLNVTTALAEMLEL
jgi:hypothetical protein